MRLSGILTGQSAIVGLSCKLLEALGPMPEAVYYAHTAAIVIFPLAGFAFTLQLAVYVAMRER